MNRILKVTFVLLISTAAAFAQKAAPVYSLCGQSGNCSMSWNDFLTCKKQLATTDKNLTVNSFLLTVQRIEKRDTVWVEYPAKGNAFSKQALEAIDKLYKDKKMGNKVLIEAVEIVQSGKEARKVPGMTITLN